jgi:hypothetical protein
VDLCRELDIISEIRKGRLPRLGHVERMPEETTAKKVFNHILEEKRSFEKPRMK